MGRVMGRRTRGTACAVSAGDESGIAPHHVDSGAEAMFMMFSGELGGSCPPRNGLQPGGIP